MDMYTFSSWLCIVTNCDPIAEELDSAASHGKLARLVK